MSRKTTNKMWNHQRNSQVWNRDTNNNQVFNHDTHLCVDLKTILRHDRKMTVGKGYQGVLCLDSDTVIDDFLYRDPHYTFTETLPWTTKRNPRIFRGKYISITRRDDGTLRLNFRPMPATGKGFSLERYVTGVAQELVMGLWGRVEER